MIFVCHVTNFVIPCDQGVLWIYGQEPFKISSHPTKFRGRRYCGSGDIMVSASHVMSQDQLVRGSFVSHQGEPTSCQV